MNPRGRVKGSVFLCIINKYLCILNRNCYHKDWNWIFALALSLWTQKGIHILFQVYLQSQSLTVTSPNFISRGIVIVKQFAGERVNFLVLRRATLEARQMALVRSTLRRLRLTLIATNSSIIISIILNLLMTINIMIVSTLVTLYTSFYSHNIQKATRKIDGI